MTFNKRAVAKFAKHCINDNFLFIACSPVNLQNMST